MAKKKRRKKVIQGEFSPNEEQVAYLLKKTFLVEKRKFLDNQRLDPTPGEVPCDLDLNRKIQEDAEEFPEETPSSLSAPDQMWLDIARRVIKSRFSPELFVRRYFATLRPEGRPPLPNAFKSDRAFAAYEEGREAFYQSVQVAFRMQAETAEVEMALAQQHEPKKLMAWEMVLMNDRLALSALFRYCLALRIRKDHGAKRFLQVANNFERMAALQYMEDPSIYDEIWGDWIPDKFKQEAAGVYEEVYGS
jgi:hypothetical protein